MRIVSLLPSATEIVCQLGLADMLVGVSHACDYPPDIVDDLPRLTRSGIPDGMSSAEIDTVVTTRLRRGENLFVLEGQALTKLAPDLVITQDLCDVGTASFGDLCALTDRLPGDTQIVSLAMPNLEDLFSDVLIIAEAVGMPERGRKLCDRLQARLEYVRSRVAHRPRPGVVSLEWLDPPFATGHWTPELIELAGGRELLGQKDGRPYRVSWEQISSVAPDVLLLMPWGHSSKAAERSWLSLKRPQFWHTIPAIRNGRVYALDAHSYSLRPSPRVIDGVEHLANLLHPGCFTSKEVGR
ncbi:MAG: ABC transporter substrate-binding protein [Oscillochloris sp.]|nr:ABC transporter substrate-binding protein [Oscillochloris sp.]